MPAGAWARLRAFAWDYLLFLGWLAVLVPVGAWLTLGPLSERWTALFASPARADAIAFSLTVLPVTLYFALTEASAAGASWGKRRLGLRVERLDGSRVSLGRSLARSALKFLPWQLSHSVLFRVPGFPVAPESPPPMVVALQLLAWLLVACWLLGLSALFGHRTPYDRLAGTRVVQVSGRETAQASGR